ncbi:NAD(P)/FAD-dependent oxidoreductase [Streptomyces sp. NPDC013181]|uniref:NAD(P)/FAD-dependent oxidoreductase n=1 Tax=Streptomyces sp. NPDC013181 TaxID=3364864 RepID=UPI0036C30EA6
MQVPEQQYDAVIVGGGPAGATTGALLAKRGHRVLILERETFPRYHIGESLITGMMAVFEELDLLERIEALGFPRKNGLSIVWGAENDLWNVSFSQIEGPYSYSYHVRRAEFDKLLLDRARELGATVLENTPVTGLLKDGDRVTGVRCLPSHGPSTEVRAPLVIDASGQARVLTRKLTSVEWQDDLRNVAYWTYFSPAGDLPEGQEGNILIERVPDGWFWAIPVEDKPNKLSVGYVTTTQHLSESGTGLEELYWQNVKSTVQLQKLLEGSEQTGEFRTTRDWSYRVERFSGPGWLAAGDAGGFIDPLFSGGVCLAVLAADAVAAAADVAIRRPDLEDEAFEAYHRGINDMVGSFLDYVRYFYDPQRSREDYFQRAQSMADYHERYPHAQDAFVAVVSGTLALSTYFGIPRLDGVDPRAAVAGA